MNNKKEKDNKLIYPAEICKRIGECKEDFYKLESGKMSPSSMQILRRNNPEKYKVMAMGMLLHKNGFTIEDTISLIHVKKEMNQNAKNDMSFENAIKTLNAFLKKND